MLNKHEFYQATVKHLLDQNEPCLESGGACMYRSKGKKCAIGFHIKDEDYTERMEFTSVTELVKLSFCPQYLVDMYRSYPALMQALQRLHDSWMNRTSTSVLFVDRAKEIANEFKIDPKYIPEFS